MAFIHDLDDLAKRLSTRKDTLKRSLINFGFEEDKDFIVSKTLGNDKNKNGGGQNREIIKLTQKVYEQILTAYTLRCRKELKLDKVCNLEYVKRFLPEETEILDFVYDVLSKDFNVQLQYAVSNYRIDMYIQDLQIAIECDENDHIYRNKDYDYQRQKYIESELKCKFIRFNPHCTSFSLSKLLRIIVTECYDRKNIKE